MNIEGLLHAPSYDPAGGKQFLGAALHHDDGTRWVLDYDEQSPFHGFDSRRVVASGEPCTPPSQQIISRDPSRPIRHFRVETMRLVDEAPDAELLEIGTRRNLTGQFERGTNGDGGTALRFVTDDGDAFRVVNDPVGLTFGARVTVVAYPVRVSPSISTTAGEWIWAIGPYSMNDLWEWRGRRRRM